MVPGDGEVGAITGPGLSRMPGMSNRKPCAVVIGVPQETPANTGGSPGGSTGGGTITLPDTGAGVASNDGSFVDPAGAALLVLAGVGGVIAYGLRRRVAA